MGEAVDYVAGYSDVETTAEAAEPLKQFTLVLESNNCADMEWNYEDLIEEDSLDEPIAIDAANEQQECNELFVDEAIIGKYLCEECRQVFDDIATAQAHECTASWSQPPSVECADELLMKETLAIETSYTTLQNSAFTCNICAKHFGNQRSFSNHQRLHNVLKASASAEPQRKCEPQEINCELCNSKFGSIKNYKMHLRIHQALPQKTIEAALPVGVYLNNCSEQFYCEMCNKSFDKKLLEIHKNMHQNLNDVFCNICNKQFADMISYNIHMNLHKGKVKERPQTAKKNLNADKRCFPCQYCGHVFAKNHQKVRHERVHTGEKPYACEVCGKTFRISNSLTLHLRTHTDIRPFACSICHKSFKSQPVYMHHLRTHSSERSYQCPECPKTFRTSVQLSGHRNTHSKPFNCPQCSRPFSTMYAVKLHMKTHKQDNKIEEHSKQACAVCGAVYARAHALRLHLKEQHNLQHNEVNQIVQNVNDEQSQGYLAFDVV